MTNAQAAAIVRSNANDYIEVAARHEFFGDEDLARCDYWSLIAVADAIEEKGCEYALNYAASLDTILRDTIGVKVWAHIGGEVL